MAKSTHSRPAGKAKKPHPDFPLWPLPSGRRCKKVRGRFCYFGRIADDPKGESALTLWLEQKDDLLVGRTPGPKGSVLLADNVNAYLADADHRHEAGEL